MTDNPKNSDFGFAGFFHDIGKFLERAKVSIPPEWENRNQALYQPKFSHNGREFYTHKHALFTAYFLENWAKYIPEEFSRNVLEGDSILNISAMHHKPESSNQWLVAHADRIAAGMDRTQFEKYNQIEDEPIGRNAYREIRLLSLFETIDLEGKNSYKSREDHRYYYELKKMSSDSIFPSRGNSMGQADDYSSLWSSFIKEFEALPFRGSPQLWLEQFESLFMKYSHSIPSATVDRTVPDVSLYDHCRLTGAISSCLYHYHLSNGSVGNIKNYTDEHKNENRFILVQGKWNGIQNFIYSEGGSTNKKSAKILRGRSLMVSLYSELAGDYLLEKLQLESINMIQNAAGKFLILASNTESTIQYINETEKEINEYLMESYYGEVSLSISYQICSGSDFMEGGIRELLQVLNEKLEEKKFKRNSSSLGVVQNYLDHFNSSLNAPLCPYCGKRPSTTNNHEDPKCDPCEDQIEIGKLSPKRSYLGISLKPVKSIDSIGNPVFNKYYITFFNTPPKEDKEISWKHFWNIGGLEEDTLYSRRYYRGYVPTIDESEVKQISKTLNILEKDLLEKWGEINEPATFQYIAEKNLELDEKEKKGIIALSTLSMDIDNLGGIFAKGLPKPTLSQIVSISRQLNLFFSAYVSYKCSTQFKNIYTLFAGGDDLVQIGPPREIFDYMNILRKDFETYTCNNPNIHVSAGLSLNKPGEGVRKFLERSDTALGLSKINRNSISFFGIAVTWKEYETLLNFDSSLSQWKKNGSLSTSMLYRFISFCDKSERAKQVLLRGGMKVKEIGDFLWKSQLKYSFYRNFINKIDPKSGKSMLEETSTIPGAIEKYGEKLKIPIWKTIYQTRKYE